MKKRDFYFDNLKALLIIAVIIGNSLEYANPTSIDVHYFILFLYIFHMPLFTFVSGYFCTKSKRSTQEKVVYILKIYLFAQVFYYILERVILKNITHSFDLFSSQWTLWYLLSLMCWYIISDFVKNKKKWLIGSILVSLLIGFDNGIGSYASISRTFFFLPFFIAGMCFKKEYIDELKKYKYKLFAGSALILITLYIISDNLPVELLFEYTKYKFYFDSAIFPLSVRIFHYIGAFTLGAFILILVPENKMPLHSIGANSLVMYICHSGIIKIIYPFSFIRYSTPLRVFISEAIILGATILFTVLFVKVKELYKENLKLKNLDINKNGQAVLDK